MDKMDVFRQKLETQLKEWKSKIEMLEDRASNATGETKTELMRAIGEVRLKKEVVMEKLNALQKESSVAWDTMKEGVEKATAELKSALDKVISRFK